MSNNALTLSGRDAGGLSSAGQALNTSTSAAEIEHAVIEAMAEIGIVPKDRRAVIADGEIHRFRHEDDRPDSQNCWVVAYTDGRPAASFGCWKRELKGTWCASLPRTNEPAQTSAPKPALKQCRIKPKAEANRAPSRTQQYAAELWLACQFEDEIVGAHPYAVAKGIDWAAGAGRTTASGLRVGRNADCLIVPIRTEATGKVQAVQAINASGDKQTFGPIKGGCLVLGNTLDLSIPWYVAEGWASAVSVVFHHHGGNAVCAAAFGKSNLDPAAEILSRVFAPPEITILEERDA